MVVNEYFIEKVHVSIHDNHYRKPEDLPTVLNRLIKIATKALQPETDKTYKKTPLFINGGNNKGRL